eukprot:scaffold32418_cov36-Tisochrysis_lutea.AAC.1
MYGSSEAGNEAEEGGRLSVCSLVLLHLLRDALHAAHTPSSSAAPAAPSPGANARVYPAALIESSSA